VYSIADHPQIAIREMQFRGMHCAVHAPFRGESVIRAAVVGKSDLCRGSLFNRATNLRPDRRAADPAA
jgi:hypothetical protein